ncbi:MAG: hypothetical protein AAF921_27640 [Cyanobacteria bacterium P01_D01_bin.44]
MRGRVDWMHKQPPLGLLFWGLLPLLGILFWGLAGAVTHHLLKQPNASVFEVQVTTTPSPNPIRLLAIKVDIYESKGTSQVTLKSVKPDIITQTLELPDTNPAAIESTLAQKLNLPISTIRRQVQYRERD